jgi:hypothetical protein
MTQKEKLEKVVASMVNTNRAVQIKGEDVKTVQKVYMLSELFLNEFIDLTRAMDTTVPLDLNKAMVALKIDNTLANSKIVDKCIKKAYIEQHKQYERISKLLKEFSDHVEELYKGNITTQGEYVDKMYERVQASADNGYCGYWLKVDDYIAKVNEGCFYEDELLALYDGEIILQGHYDKKNNYFVAPNDARLVNRYGNGKNDFDYFDVLMVYRITLPTPPPITPINV